MSPAVVEEQRGGGVVLLRLAQPQSRNAFSPEIKEFFEARLPEIAVDAAVRCLVITGTDKAFCAGGDLRTLQGEMRTVPSRERMARGHRWVGALLNMEKPVITAINGAAVGAGFGLALLGDISIAADDAFFQAGFSAIGVAADYGLGLTLPRAVGMPRAKDLLFSNRRVDAPEAGSMGLVSRVVPAGELLDIALKQAERLAAGPVYSMGLTKHLLNRSYEDSIPAYLEREAMTQAIAFGGDERMEGVDAFMNKRRARFV